LTPSSSPLSIGRNFKEPKEGWASLGYAERRTCGDDDLARINVSIEARSL